MSKKNEPRALMVARIMKDVMETYIQPGKCSSLELAEMCGVTRVQLYNWLRGSSAPTDVNFEKFLVALDKLAARA